MSGLGIRCMCTPTHALCMCTPTHVLCMCTRIYAPCVCAACENACRVEGQGQATGPKTLQSTCALLHTHTHTHTYTYVHTCIQTYTHTYAYRAKDITEHVRNAHLEPRALVITKDMEHMQQVRQPVRVSEGRLLCHPLEAEACVGVARAGAFRWCGWCGGGGRRKWSMHVVVNACWRPPTCFL